MAAKLTPKAYPVPRRWPRFRVTAPIVVQFGMGGGVTSTSIAGSTWDISEGGVFVVTHEGVKMGAHSQVHIGSQLFGKLLSATGEVVRSEPTGFAIQFEDALPGAAQLVDGH